MVSQVDGSFEAKDSRMVEYLKLVGQLMSEFHKARVVQISRGKIKHADSLATLASSMDDCIPRLITIEVLSKPSIEQRVGISVVSSLGVRWMDPIIEFMAEKVLPNETKEAE